MLTCTHNICSEQKYENSQQKNQLKNVIFTAVKNRSILHGRVFVMKSTTTPSQPDLLQNETRTGVSFFIVYGINFFVESGNHTFYNSFVWELHIICSLFLI